VEEPLLLSVVGKASSYRAGYPLWETLSVCRLKASKDSRETEPSIRCDPRTRPPSPSPAGSQSHGRLASIVNFDVPGPPQFLARPFFHVAPCPKFFANRGELFFPRATVTLSCYWPKYRSPRVRPPPKSFLDPSLPARNKENTLEKASPRVETPVFSR